jgi:hypothetical protein
MKTAKKNKIHFFGSNTLTMFVECFMLQERTPECDTAMTNDTAFPTIPRNPTQREGELWLAQGH